VNSGQLSEHAAEHDDDERTEEGEGELALTARLATGDHRSEEDPGRHERGCDEEDRELHVPGSDEVEGERLGYVDPEEAPQVGPVVLGGGADGGLKQEQPRHHEEEPSRRPLARRERHVARKPECERRLLTALPAQPPPAEDAEQDPDPAKQGDQGDHGPHDHVRARLVANPRLRGPVVRVGVVVAGPAGRGGPARPGEEGGQLPDLLGVVDRLGTQTEPGGRLAEEALVVPVELLERRRLLGRQLQRSGGRVVAVDLELVDRLLARRVRLVSPELVANRFRGPPQIVGREVRPEVCAVPEYRAVLHEAVTKEHLLPLADVILGEHRGPARIHGACGNRRVGLVRAVGEQAENEEADHEDQQRELKPRLGDDQLALATRLTGAPLPLEPFLVTPHHRSLRDRPQVTGRSYFGAR
jgi:hypothetical protein